MTQKKFLITGGAGFIGARVCRQLLELGHQPIVYDAFVQYISPFESFYQKFLEWRFKGIREQVIFERGDTRDKYDVHRIITKHRPNVIIHLAALPIADFSFEHPEETVSSILLGALNFLDSIKDQDFVERFVFASSSMVYGDFLEVPCPEDHPKKPKDIYGGTKLAGEVMVETYGRRFGLEYCIVRPSAVYGPTDVNRRVVQIFLEKALAGETLVLHGGDSTLDFTYVEDIASGFVLAGTHPQAANQVFNITRGQGRTLKELVDILKLYFPALETRIEPHRVYRPKRGSLSIAKAREVLGFEPRFTLEEGIGRYVEFYRKSNSC